MGLRARGHVLVPVLIAAIFAVLAGCGDDGGSDAASSGGDGTTAVTVQDVAGIPSEFLTAGVKQGFFEKRGLDVTVKTAAGGAAIIPAVVSGDAQIGGSNVVSALIATEKELPLAMIAAGTFGPETEEDDWSAEKAPALDDLPRAWGGRLARPRQRAPVACRRTAAGSSDGCSAAHATK
jgi:NitT/TauT family transport system substrate-binding protein